MRISGRQLMLFTTRWAEELADGNRMAAKEKRALADGVLTPSCVFVFGGGRKGGRELRDSALVLQTSKVFILMPSLQSPLITFHHISQRRNQAGNREKTRGKILLTCTTINSPPCRITLPGLEAS